MSKPSHNALDDDDGFRSVVVFVVAGVVLFAIFVAGVLYMRAVADRADAQELSAWEAAWRKAGCPTYKTECGSKAKYACEKAVLVTGRIRVGDLVFTAAPTCEVPK